MRRFTSFAAFTLIIAGVTVVITLLMVRTSAGQAANSQARQTAKPARIAGKPNFSGIWQAMNEAQWDLEAHGVRAAALTQPGVAPYEYARLPAAPVLALGAAGGIPASLGVVQGDGRIPYKPDALKVKQDNAAHWVDRDPELKCYLPGIPRAMYMPYPFEITQSTNKVHMAFEFTNTARTIHLDKVAKPPADTWMGHSVGRWDGDTLVVDVTDFNDKTWFDRAGNYHSDALRVIERFSLKTPDVIWYEATLTDPNVFSAPWTIAMPLYRRMEPNAQLTEYQCIDMVEEFLYGNLRKKPVVSHWESETMTIDVKRKIPPGDKFYEWFRR